MPDSVGSSVSRLALIFVAYQSIATPLIMHCVSCNTFNNVSLSGTESRSATLGPDLYGARFTVVFFCPSLRKGLVGGDVVSNGSM